MDATPAARARLGHDGTGLLAGVVGGLVVRRLPKHRRQQERATSRRQPALTGGRGAVFPR